MREGLEARRRTTPQAEDIIAVSTNVFAYMSSYIRAILHFCGLSTKWERNPTALTASSHCDPAPYVTGWLPRG